MARKNFGPKPNVYPMPVYIIAAYDEAGNANAMNAAWGGITGHSEISINVSKTHKTVMNLRETGAFTVSVADADHVVESDFVGIVSGNKDPEKMAKSGFTTSKSEFVNAPIINELAICLECNVKEYNEETMTLVGEIVNVSVDESVMTDDKVDIAKAKPITFDPFNHEYYVLGEKVGTAFADGAKLK